MSVLLVEKQKLSSGYVEIWTLNRPDKLNALNSEVLRALQAEGIRLERDLEKDLKFSRALILIGAGEKAFVAGADIAEMKNFGAKEAEAFSRLGHEAMGRLENLPIPTIAAVQGFALGGGLELAMSCDVILAKEGSQFGQPESFLGLIPGFAATGRFAERVGPAKALELFYSGRRIGNAEAYDWGLVQRLVATQDNLLQCALTLAEELTLKSSPEAVARVKKVVNVGRQWRTKVFEAEIKSFGEAFETKDAKEGIAAFLEKRKAEF